MPSMYLQGGDPTAYGVPDATAAQVQNASATVDAFLKRPEGLVWAPDANGAPCYMAALSPSLSLTAAAGLAAGSNIVVPVPAGMTNPDMPGDILIVDRADPAKTEACVVSAIGPTSITLATVTRSHSAGVLLEAGLVLLEERAMAENRSTTRVSRTPVAKLLSGQGRYSYGRRSQQRTGISAGLSMLASVQVFGGPPPWTLFDLSQASVSSTTGEVWVPPGLLAAYYSDVRLRYVAGWPIAGLPTGVKQATANLVAQLIEYPEISGNFRKVQAGGTSIERFKDSILDSDTQDLLTSFQAKLYF